MSGLGLESETETKMHSWEGREGVWWDSGWCVVSIAFHVFSGAGDDSSLSPGDGPSPSSSQPEP